jgi:hypothetical protein
MNTEFCCLGPDVGEYSPYTQSVPSVKSLDHTHEAALDSPTVSSSVPGNNENHGPSSYTNDASYHSNNSYYANSVPSSSTGQTLAGRNSGSGGNGSRPDSISSSLGSPSVHSTTPSLSGPYESIKPPSSNESMKQPSSVDSYSAPSPSTNSMRSGKSRHDSVDSSASLSSNLHRTGSVGSPMSPAVSNNLESNSEVSKYSSMENLVGSPDTDADKTLVDLTSDDYTSSFKSDTFTCYSQPSSPSKMKINQQSNSPSVYKAQSMNDNLHRHAIHRLQSQNHGGAAIKQEVERYGDSHTDDEKTQAQQAGIYI